MNNTEVKSGV